MDTAAFDHRYAELFADLRRLCGALGAGQDAEDVAQEVLIYGRSRLEELRDDTKLVPWLRRIAVRTVGRSRQRPWADASISLVANDAGLGVIDLGLDERAALRRLTGRQREFVVLVYFAGHRQEEVAQMLGVSRGNVARTLWEARSVLARVLADYHEGNPDVL